jgi:hypothetical protein
MTIYEELIKRVGDGEYFHINFEKRNMKVGNDYLIKDGEFDKSKALINPIFNNHCLEDILRMILQRYRSYKISLPSERSDSKRRKYFKALPVEEITDEQLMVAERREVAQAALEGFVLCMIVNGQLVWDEELMGKWFYQHPSDTDLIILRSWIEGK